MNFNFEKNYVLKNDKVLLRPLELNDEKHLFPFSIQEPELWKYSMVSAAGDGLNNYMQNSVEARREKRDYPFIVYDLVNNEYAGSTRFYDIQLQHRTLLLGYTWYGKKFQGTGLNKNCKFLLLKFAFEEMEFERVELRADIHNERSIAAMKSIGCVQEGILRNHLYLSPTTRRSSIVFSILKEEWFHSVKQLLSNRINT